MAADEVSEDKEAIVTAIERTVHRMAREMDLVTGINAVPSNLLDVPSGPTFTAASFTTGFDGTETTMAFTLDFSILYGDGTSGDILTGS